MRKAPVGVTRERVQGHLSKGLKPREIAQLLHISTQAVYQHLSKIKERTTEPDDLRQMYPVGDEPA